MRCGPRTLQRHSSYHGHVELPHVSSWGAHNGNVLIRRRPNRGVGRPEEQNATRTDRRGDMRDAAIVTDEELVFEQGGEMRERQVFCKLDWLPAPSLLQRRRLCAIGFTSNDRERVALRQE